MAIQFRRGTGTANDGFTGLEGEISIDFTGQNIRVHDGSTAGGAFSVGISEAGDGNTDLSVNYATESFTITSSTGSNATVVSATASQAGALSAADKSKLDGIEAGAQVNTVEPADIEDFETSAELDTRDTDNRDRSNHTGTQTASTISDFTSATTAVIESGEFTLDFGVLGS